MAGATNQWTATAAITGVGGGTAGILAVAVGRYCHLRSAPGICLILQCKISKVVERPGVHYRGRHSPWISSYRDGSFSGSTPARIFFPVKRGDLTNHGRSILVSIGRNVENRDSARRKHRYHLYR